jgi:ABC-type branched-subunit amino acid transport system ATPase component
MNPVPEQIGRPGYLGGLDWQLENFADITVLLGRNGAGKSVLLRQWRSAHSATVHYINPERSGNIAFDANVYTQLINNNEMPSEQNIDPQYRQKSATSIQRYLTSYAIHEGKVLFSQRELASFLNIVLPGYEFELIDRPPFWKGRRVDTGLEITSSDQLSSGESQMLSMTMDIATQYGRLPEETFEFKALLIDEPDAHIHPDVQINFCKFISDLQRRLGLRVVIATHSLELICGLALHCPERTGIAIVRPKDARIRAQKVDELRVDALSALGGGVIMGRIFGSMILLVEGDDDHDMWSQAARHGLLDITVVPCGGGDKVKRKQRLLENLFAGLRDPRPAKYGIALLDGDQPLPSATPDCPQDYITFVRLNCRESENLILADEVLAKVGLDWPSAQARITQSGCDEEIKARLLAISSDDRQSANLKGLLPALEAIIFPNMGRWTRVVGNVLGPARPEGQLRQFVGDVVIDSLYGPVLETVQAPS